MVFKEVLNNFILFNQDSSSIYVYFIHSQHALVYFFFLIMFYILFHIFLTIKLNFFFLIFFQPFFYNYFYFVLFYLAYFNEFSLIWFYYFYFIYILLFYLLVLFYLSNIIYKILASQVFFLIMCISARLENQSAFIKFFTLASVSVILISMLTTFASVWCTRHQSVRGNLIYDWN